MKMIYIVAEIMSVLQKMYVNSNEPFSDPRLGDL